MKKTFFLFKRQTYYALLVLTALGLQTPAFAEGEAANHLSSTESLQQEKRKISGLVTDATGEALIGVSVELKGARVGTVTDLDGKFSLDVPLPSSLTFTYIGYETRTVNVANATMLSIVMQESSNLLNELVVTGIGNAQKKASLTGAISNINSDDITRTSATTTSGALVGKIAGVNTRMPDGRPGSNTWINIRNMGTPLFVIDGIQMDEGQFNNIDYNDVESISILKDASASIYGVRAANGVVVVTTKKGKIGSANVVSINSHLGIQSLYDFPRPANAATYVEAMMNSDAIGGVKNPKYSQQDLEKWKQGTEKGYQPFDWFDYIFNSAPQYYVGANITGGSEKINYYLAVAHLNQDAIIKNYGGFERTNVQMSVEGTVMDRLKIGANMNARIESRKNPGVPGPDDYWAPIYASFRNLPTSRPFANDNPNYPAQTSSDASSNFAMLNYERSGKFEETWRVIQMNFTADYDIGAGFKAKALGSYYFGQKYMNNHEYTYKLYGYDETTDTYPVVFHNTNPWRERKTEMVEEINTQIQLLYDKEFGLHGFSGVAGFETKERNTPQNWIHSIPTSNALSLIDYPTMDTYNDDGNRTEARMGSFGRINYNYAQKYLLELSGRYDGSWLFPPGKRWGFFPSASVGWRISEEDFWQGDKLKHAVSDLKIRASYGMVGDDKNGDNYIVNPFAFMEGYDYKEGGSVIDGKYVIGSSPRGLPVRELSWLKAKILDVGIDYGFFGGKVYGTLDYFRRERTGLPAARYDVLIPSEVGFGLPNENLNSDLHTGMDGAIAYKSKAGDLNYTLGGNFSYARMYDWHQYKPRFGNSINEYRNSINERLSHISWGLEAIGQFQSWEQIANYTVDNDRQGNKTIRPGDIMYKDVNGDGVINDSDVRPIGYRGGSLPILNFGLNFAFDYKYFDLAFDLTGSSYSSYFKNWELRNPFQNGANSPQDMLSDQWHLADINQPNGDLIPGKYPTALEGNAGHSNYWPSTFWMTNVRYIKLRNLELGYKLPKKILAASKMTSARIYVSGQNLFGFDNVGGIDPEITSENGLQYSTMRVYTIGLNIKF
ncbi:SusC/RagA family TonB-linked outer membrane protein [Bacteroidales bacterium]|nr:SusC/RagA family TonB-linked outer membrane protein [Bacteroidales bacterium]